MGDGLDGGRERGISVMSTVCFVGGASRVIVLPGCGGERVLKKV